MVNIKKAINLQNKIITSIVIIVIFFGLFIIILFKSTLNELMINRLKYKGIFISESIARYSINSMLTENKINMIELINEEKNHYENVEYIFITDEHNNVVTYSFKDKFPHDLIDLNNINSTRKTNVELINLNNKQFYDFASPMLVRNHLIGTVRVGLSNKSNQVIIAKITGKFLFATFLFTIIAMFFGVGLSKIITSPISQITEKVQTISSSNFNTLIKFGTRAKCWEITNCDNPDCVAYKNTDIRCWHIAGSYCCGSKQGKFAKKLRSCNDCIVYQMYSGDEIQKLADAFDVMTKELKDDQEKIVHTEKLTVIGTLSSSIAHELRNPLGAIKNAVYYIKSKIGKTININNDPSVNEFLDIINQEINSSNKIITDLLFFTRIDKVASKLNDINKIVDVSLSILEIPDNIVIIKEFGDNLPQVMIDGDQIRQVFINLINNACDAMQAGGSLTIKTGLQKDKVEVEFIDTGCGIEKDEIHKIFEPLYTTKAKGIGLGLAITKAIINKHFGTIEVKSEVSHGTTFKVLLPV